MIRVALAIAATVAVLTTIACGDDDDAASSTPTATAVVTGSNTRTPAPTATATTAGDPSILTSGTFDPKISLSAPDWEVSEDTGNSFLVEHPGTAYASIYFLKIVNVTNPDTLRRESAPADLAAWLRGHPSLNVLAEENVVVAGRAAIQLDVSTSTTHDVELFPQGQGTIALYATDAARIVIIDEDTGHFLIMIGTGQPPDLEGSLQVAQPLMESLQFD